MPNTGSLKFLKFLTLLLLFSGSLCFRTYAAEVLKGHINGKEITLQQPSHAVQEVKTEKNSLNPARRRGYRDTILFILKTDAGRMLPSTFAKNVNYLFRLAHHSNTVFLLFIMIIYFFLLSIFMGVYMIVSKLRTNFLERKQKRYERIFHGIIASYLFQDKRDTSVPSRLKAEKSAFKKQVLANLMVRLYNDLEGDIAVKLRKLYLELGLERVSLRRVKHGRWFMKIRGVRELAIMDVETATPFIRKHIFSSNDELRSESMIALVRLDKDTPFAFLHELTSPLTKWEQLSIFSMARKYQVKVPQFKQFLGSTNSSVVCFALSMISIYQQMDAAPQITGLLKHSDPDVRGQAIKLAGEFNLTVTEQLLRDAYENEPEENQLEIIKSLGKMPDLRLTGFFSNILRQGSGFRLSLAAVKSLKESGAEGEAALSTLMEGSGQYLGSIYQHITDNRI